MLTNKFTQTHVRTREAIERLLEMINNLQEIEKINTLSSAVETLSKAYKTIKMGEFVYPEDGPPAVPEEAQVSDPEPTPGVFN